MYICLCKTLYALFLHCFTQNYIANYSYTFLTDYLTVRLLLSLIHIYKMVIINKGNFFAGPAKLRRVPDFFIFLFYIPF